MRGKSIGLVIMSPDVLSQYGPGHDFASSMYMPRTVHSTSIHLESEVLQFAFAFDLKDDRIAGTQIVDQGLEL